MDTAMTDVGVVDPRSLEELAAEVVPVVESRAKTIARAKAKIVKAKATPSVKVVTPKATTKPTAKAVAVGTKTCRICGKTKPLAEYRVKNSRPDGRDTLCTLCARAWKPAAKAANAVAKPVAKASARKPLAKPVAK